jgi:hypothetical protein
MGVSKADILVNNNKKTVDTISCLLEKMAKTD